METVMNETIIRGSNNVFKDLGLENPDGHKAKADLALKIIEIIEKKKLTQEEAARLIGAAQPDISRLRKGQLKGFTLDRLCMFLLKLGRHIEIRVTNPKNKDRQGILETA